jgi:hypothetical protein
MSVPRLRKAFSRGAAEDAEDLHPKPVIAGRLDRRVKPGDDS